MSILDSAILTFLAIYDQNYNVFGTLLALGVIFLVAYVIIYLTR